MTSFVFPLPLHNLRVREFFNFRCKACSCDIPLYTYNLLLILLRGSESLLRVSMQVRLRDEARRESRLHLVKVLRGKIRSHCHRVHSWNYLTLIASRRIWHEITLRHIEVVKLLHLSKMLLLVVLFMTHLELLRIVIFFQRSLPLSCLSQLLRPNFLQLYRMLL